MTITHDNLDDFEAEIDAALSGLAPTNGFEDRLIDRLRNRSRRFALTLPRVNPFVLRSALGVAATIAVAAIGYVGMQALENPRHNLAVGDSASTSNGWEFQAGQGQSRTRRAPAESLELGDLRKSSDLYARQRGIEARPAQDAKTLNYWKTSPFDGNDSFLLPDSNDDASKNFAGKLVLARPQVNAGEVVAEQKQERFFDSSHLRYATQTVPTEQLPALSAADPVLKPADAPAPVDAEKEKVMLGVELRAVDGKDTNAPVEHIRDSRKIIRTGNVEFEVQSFDASFATLAKIVEEEAGIIGSTESSKLENGKTRGTIVVRVPPEHLDRLVMKLRGLGELKTQNISAQDVTKQYSDLESQLRAANAMQDRLLQIIKDGKGAIKDLLAAERELGNWRTKIEQLEGERRFIDSQVSLSTIAITLTEKDISQAATLTRTETVNAGVECEDVEKSRAQLLTAIEELGGRVLSADLKQLDAGQFNASIVAEMKAENSGQLIDRLKQLGRVARLTAERAEKASDGSTSAATPKVETKPSVFQISLYNLANIAPRTTQTITFASADVEGAYRTLLAEANKLAGKVVASEMNHPQPEVTSATIRIDIPSEQADAFQAKLKSLGVIVTSVDSQSTDNANVTTTKRGFSLTLIDVATVPPRENVSATVRIESAGNALATLLANVQTSKGKVIAQNQTRDASGRDSATVTIELPASASPALMQSLQSLGKVESVTSTQNANVPAGELARARYDIQLATADAIAPRDGFWNSVRDGLAISFRGLGYSLQLIIVGICLIAPWALLVWAGMKVRRRMKLRSTIATPQ